MATASRQLSASSLAPQGHLSTEQAEEGAFEMPMGSVSCEFKAYLWLPVALRIKSELLAVTRQVLRALPSAYIFKLAILRPLHSSSHNGHPVPHTSTRSCSGTFAHAASSAKNTLCGSLSG